jgi:hypothetical protein
MLRRRSEEAMRAAMRQLAARYANLFRAWGATGGKARANRLTAEQRQAIAQNAARARWAKAKKKS